MGRSRFCVRFAPVKSCEDDPVPMTDNGYPAFEEILGFRTDYQQRSRSGCLKCRRRRVKCDEAYPICVRCQKRGDICMPGSRKTRWRMEMPWLASARLSYQPASSVFNLAHANEHLLRHWFEHASHIMVLDPEKNPLSYSFTECLFQSPSLLHVLQSISAAHEQFFQPPKLLVCLEERGKTLSILQNEILHAKQSLLFNLLTIIMLGLSAPWVDETKSEFGREHLLAARNMVEQVITENEVNALSHYIVGKYIYWDMACSFLVDPDEQQPIDNPVIDTFIQQTQDMFHPTVGYSIETFYVLAWIGRYYRSVVENGGRDTHLERVLEELALREVAHKQEDPDLHWLSDGFRKIGLITLYRIQLRYAGIPGSLVLTPIFDGTEDSVLSVEIDDTEQMILDYARLTIDDLASLPITSPYLNLQSLPLLMAGAELTASDEQRRCDVRQRYRALFSLNRLPVNLQALQLLEDLWVRHDQGDQITWLELMISNGSKLMLG